MNSNQVIKSEPKLPGWQIAGRQKRKLFVSKGHIVSPNVSKYVDDMSRKGKKEVQAIYEYKNPLFSSWQKLLATAIHKGSHVIVDVVTSCGKTWATNLIVAHEVLSRDTATALIVSPNTEVMRECLHDICTQNLKKYKYPHNKMIDTVSRKYVTYDETRPPPSQIVISSVESLIEFITNTINEPFVKKLKYIIFDEAHLPSISEGLWWVRYIPQTAQLILLSATLGNCKAVEAIVNEINCSYASRPREIVTIKYDIRPIPLQYVLYKGLVKTLSVSPSKKQAIVTRKNSSEDGSSEDESSEDGSSEDDSSEDESSEALKPELTGFAPKTLLRAGRLDLIVNPYDPTPRDLKSLDKTFIVPKDRAEQSFLGQEIISKNMDIINSKLEESLLNCVVEPTVNNIYDLLSYLFSNSMQPVMVFHSTTEATHNICDKLVTLISNLENDDPLWSKARKQLDKYEKEQLKMRDAKPSKKRTTRNDDEDDKTENLPVDIKNKIDIHLIQATLTKWHFPNTFPSLGDTMPKKKTKKNGDYPVSEPSIQWIKDCLDYGIGVYVSTMPEWLKHRVFDAFKDGDLNVLMADSTISVGINLPIRSCIICGDDITPTLFKQVSGRAGRMGYDDQGYVIPLFSKEKIKTYFMTGGKQVNIVIPQRMSYTNLVRLSVPHNLDIYFKGDVIKETYEPVSKYKQSILELYFTSIDAIEMEVCQKQLSLIKDDKWHYHRLTNLIKALPGNHSILFIKLLVSGHLHKFTVMEFVDLISILMNRIETSRDSYLPTFERFPGLINALQVYGDKYDLSIDFSKPINNYFIKFCKDGILDTNHIEKIEEMGEWLYLLKMEIEKVTPETDEFRKLLCSVDRQYIISRNRRS